MVLITKNICSDGAFLLTDKPLQVGTKVKVALYLSIGGAAMKTARKSLINVSGEVIRAEEAGMAVRFDKKFTISPARTD